MKLEKDILNALDKAYKCLGAVNVREYNLCVLGIGGLGIGTFWPELYNYDPIQVVATLKQMHKAGKVEINDSGIGISIRKLKKQTK